MKGGLLMKTMIPALLAYIIVCLIVLLSPASEGYNSFVWKLLVGQLYATPALLIVAFISNYVNKKLARN